MSLIAVIYKNDDQKNILFKGENNKEVKITGLAPGTIVETGKYLLAIKDTDTNLVSDKVPVPSFTVLQSDKPEAPNEVNAYSSKDGANVKVE